ncbi:MAG: TolC family protein [Verrucomicrobiales bacterium]
MTFWLRLKYLALLPLLSLGNVSAAEFTASSAGAHALRHNPDLAAARWRIEETRARLQQAGRRANPELQVEAGHNAKFREGSVMVGLVQKFPATARLRLEKEVSQALVEAAEAEVRVAEREVVLAVRQLFIKALALEAQAELRARQLANARELSAFAAKRAESGEVSSLEATQFELEAQQSTVEGQQVEVEKSAVLGELRPLLGLGSEVTLRLKGSLTVPRAMTVGVVPATRPEYQAAERNELTAQLSIDLEKSRWREDISAGLFLGGERTEDAPDGLQNDGLIGVRLSIPLPLWNKNEGKIQEATATAARRQAEKQALAQRIRAESKAAEARMRTLATFVENIDSRLLPKVAELEDQLRASYSAGQTPLIDVLRARDRRLQLEKARLGAVRDFHLIQASLGLDLPDGEGKP